jgi:tetratricopeptide (TPR) repeat protein
LGIHEVALEQYDMVIELEPNFIDVFINKAILYREMGKYEQSLEWFEKSLKMVDSTEVAFSDKGILLIILGKF